MDPPKCRAKGTNRPYESHLSANNQRRARVNDPSALIMVFCRRLVYRQHLTCRLKLIRLISSKLRSSQEGHLTGGTEMPNMDEQHRVMAVQDAHTERLFALPHVIGVGTGLRIRGGEFTGEVCVQVFVDRKLPRSRLAWWERVPPTVQGQEGEEIGTDVVETAIPRANGPAQGGDRIEPEEWAGSYNGTLGGFAIDKRYLTLRLLTCNHVISDFEKIPDDTAVLWQVSGGDWQKIGDVVWTVLLHTVDGTDGTPPATPPPVSSVDAATATVTADHSDDISAIGKAIYYIKNPQLGMNVEKRGATTGHTTNGYIATVNVTQLLWYDERKRRSGGNLVWGRVANSLRILSSDPSRTRFSDHGDSGSIIFDQEKGPHSYPVAVGLLYGSGGTEAEPASYACDINAVFSHTHLTPLIDCTAVIQSIIAAVHGISLVPAKEAQLRRFRERSLRKTPLGRIFDDFITTEARELARVLREDDDAFGLAVRMLEPWLQKKTNFEILESELDSKTVTTARRLLRLIAKSSETLRPQLELLEDALSQAEGTLVRDFLNTRLE